MPAELQAASSAVDVAQAVVDAAVRALAQRSCDNGKLSVALLDQHQAVAYDLAHAAAAVEGSRVMCRYGEHGAVEHMLACAYVADAIHDIANRMTGRSAAWDVEPNALAAAMPFVTEHRAPAFLAGLA